MDGQDEDTRSPPWVMAHNETPPSTWLDCPIDAEGILRSNAGHYASIEIGLSEVRPYNAPHFFEAYRALAEAMGISADHRPPLYIVRSPTQNGHMIEDKQAPWRRLFFPALHNYNLLVIPSATAVSRSAHHLLCTLAHELQHVRQRQKHSIRDVLDVFIDVETLHRQASPLRFSPFLTLSNWMLIPVMQAINIARVAYSRHDEWEADRAAIHYVGGKLRAESLQDGSVDNAEPAKWNDYVMSRLHSTHPPLAQRIKEAAKIGSTQKPLPLLDRFSRPHYGR